MPIVELKICRLKKLLVIIALLPASMLFAGMAMGAPTNVSSCQKINSPGEYVLNQSIVNSSSSGCINITSSDVVFDGAGYTIDGGDYFSTYGVYVYNSTIALTNVTVKNLTVTDWFYGIYYSNAVNGSITNNTANSNAEGVHLEDSNNNTLTNNNASLNTNYAFYFYNSNSNTISDNTANSDTAPADSVIGFYFYSSNNNTISNNTANSNSKYGIYLSFSNDNNLTSNDADSNGFGIELVNSNNNTLSNNTASANLFGFSLDSSGNNTLTNNNMTGNGYNFYLYGWQDAHFNNSINTSNLVDGKPIYYIRNVSDAIYDSSTNAGTFYCILCNNVTIRNLTLTKNVIGVFFWNTNNSKVENISASLNRNAGIYLSSSNNNTLVNNNISSNNDYGISLSYSYNNTLTSNIASSNLGLGISIVSSSGNILSSNNASSNNAGIAMGYSSDNILTSNNASSNNIGIFIETSSNNTLTNNNMSSNRYNFALTGSENSHFNNSIPINNTVDGKPILYIENASDLIYDSSTNAGIFYCILCNNITVKDVVLTKNVWGVLLWNTNNSKIENITVTYNLYGITLASSNSNAISNTNSSFNDLGLLIALSSSNKLSNSTANSNSRYGIAIVSSTNNTITSAVISNSKTGIYISSSNDNVLHNTTSSNSDYGFSLKSSSNNTLTDNTALNNTFWDFSASDSVNNTVINLSINPTISFTGKDISIKSASSPTSAPSGYSGTGKYINATNNSADSWLFLNVSYTDSDVSNLNESSLRMWKHNGSSWAQVSGTNSVEPAQNYVYANITSFSIFALLGEPISTPPTSPGGGGSGGGGGGGTSSENYTNVESKEKYDLHIFKNNVTSYKFTHSDPILFVNITGNVNAGEITTLVEILKNTSYLVKTPAPGIVYKNVNIWVGTSGFAVPRNIKEAIITFRVKNSWLAENNIQAEEIFMLNRAGDAWNKLETKVTGMDDKYTYMESKGGAFPNFAISGIKGIAVATSTPVPAAMIETTTKTLAPTATASQPAADMGWAFALVGFMVSATAGYFFVIKKRLM